MASARAAIVFAVFAASLVLAATAPAAEQPEPAVTGYVVEPSTDQAGGHPDVTMLFEWAVSDYETPPCNHTECTSPRVISQHFPTGFIGNPHVAPKCSLGYLLSFECPVDSQVGILYIEPNPGELRFVGLYNMEVRPDQAGMVAGVAPVLGAPIFLELSGRTDSDYGLDAIGSPIPVGLPLPSTFTQLWGVPADPVHSPHRFRPGVRECIVYVTPGIKVPPQESGCPPGTLLSDGTFAEPGVPPAPYLQNPTNCDGPLTSRLDLSYYDGSVVHAEYPWPQMVGCDQLTFNPAQTVKPTATSAETVSGVDVRLEAPLPQNPAGASPSEIRRTTVTLPEGFSLNPGAGDGKVACSDAQTSIGTLFAAACPEFSKVGTVEVNNAALPGPIFGGLYLGEPKPGEPYRLIIAADGFATHAKIPGTIHADPRTGRLTTTFEIPQTPIQEVNLHFFGSERGALITPERCGAMAVENEFVPWASELTTRRSATLVTVDSGPNGRPCPAGPRPFSPHVEAGSANNSPGAFAPFSFTLERADGDQNLSAVEVSPPPGFLASLRGVAYCPEAAIALISHPAYAGRVEQASSACPATSLVGNAVAAAGAGTHPLYVPGRVYLAGPYRGAPVSLVIVTPAVSGPYDLGNVAVRAAVRVDPVTARVTAVSDPLPQILEGIPLRVRHIRVDLDRPRFALNPTNCRRGVIGTAIFGDEGGSSALQPHFQVANCAELPFEPRLSLRLTGGVRRRGHPAIRARLRAAPGEANLRRVSVTLPKGELLDNAHIGTVCTRVAFARDACPPSARIGRVRVSTPVLDQPLRGAVYLRSSSNDLPDLVLDLEGQFEIEAAARIDSVNGRLRTTFQAIPDVPVEEVVLHLAGGKKGLLQNSNTLCGRPRRAVTRMVGQNGVRFYTRTKLQVACGKKKAKRSGRHRRNGRAKRR